MTIWGKAVWRGQVILCPRAVPWVLNLALGVDWRPTSGKLMATSLARPSGIDSPGYPLGLSTDYITGCLKKVWFLISVMLSIQLKFIAKATKGRYCPRFRTWQGWPTPPWNRWNLYFVCIVNHYGDKEKQVKFEESNFFLDTLYTLVFSTDCTIVVF